MGSPLFDISGRVALVTGASRGIGRAIARGLAEAGASVALSSRTQADLLRTGGEIHALGARAEVFPANVARPEEIKSLVREVLGCMGQIDILVNVAGVNRRAPATEITEEDWDAVLNLNLKGLFFTSQAVGRAGDVEGLVAGHPRSLTCGVQSGAQATARGATPSLALITVRRAPSERALPTVACSSAFSTLGSEPGATASSSRQASRPPRPS